MFEKNIVKTVNVNGELDINGDRWMIEKTRSGPHTVTIPPLKTCISSTKLQSLGVPIIEDDPATGVLREGAICNDMTGVIAKGAADPDNSGGCDRSGGKKNSSFEYNDIGDGREPIDDSWGTHTLDI